MKQLLIFEMAINIKHYKNVLSCQHYSFKIKAPANGTKLTQQENNYKMNKHEKQQLIQAIYHYTLHITYMHVVFVTLV